MIAGLTTRSYGNEVFLEIENTVYDFLIQNPQIENVELVWLWGFKAKVDMGTYDLEYFGTHLDEEYTIIGTRKEVLDKLDNYDCWDGSYFYDVDHPRSSFGCHNYGLHICGSTLFGDNDPNPFGDINCDDELPSNVYHVYTKIVPHEDDDEEADYIDDSEVVE